MKSRFATLALAAGSLLSVALIGCNPPIDDAKKGDTGAMSPTTKASDSATAPTVSPAPTETKPGAEAPAPSPAVEPPKVEEKPADATPAPKDDMKKEETPK